MSGYQEWAAAMGYTDPAQFDVYLAEYLETEQAKQLIAEGSAAVLASVEAIEITPEQVEGLAQALLEGLPGPMPRPTAWPTRRRSAITS